ncbi:SDR family oxidoreductase [Candidatus Poribacteria bacterium]|nr:SDR family oxidoreductase [Candidatus Poribacteria bacterium]
MGILDRFKLDGKTALVTGGGQGIGQAYAHALAEAGASVAIVDINPDTASQVAEEIKDIGQNSISIEADVTIEEDVKRMADTVAREWGKLDIAVNNAGITIWADTVEMTEKEWDDVLDLNLKGVFLCAQAEARVMIPQKYGKIINTASMSGSIVNRPQNQVSYNASKAGVIHLTKSLAAEWAPHGIRVNSISPGYMLTALVNKIPEVAQHLPYWTGLTPVGRLGNVEDLQGAIVYLASDASDFMTGHDMVIDGGYSVW